MENILRSIYQERASDISTLGILHIEKRDEFDIITDTFNEILIVITKEEQFINKNYEYNGKKLALYIISDHRVNDWIQHATNRRIYDWLYYGKIVFDRNDYLYTLIQEVKDFPFNERKKRIGIEYAKLIRTYLEGKMLFNQQQYLDAYSNIVRSLQHTARLALIEKGFHPEVSVWNQLKHVEPEVIKMYEELVYSEEPIQKRLELLFLTSDFFIHSRTDIGAAHILDVLGTRDNWTIQDIIEHPELSIYSYDLNIVLEYLVEKKFIDIILEESKGKGVYHRIYRRNK